MNITSTVEYIETPVCTLVWQADSNIIDLTINSKGLINLQEMNDEKLFAMFIDASAFLKCSNGRFLNRLCTLKEFLTAFNQLSTSWEITYKPDKKIEVKQILDEVIGTAHG